MVELIKDTIIANCFDAILFVDNDGIIHRINESARQLLNISSLNQMISLWDYVPPKKQDRYLNQWRSFITKKDIIQRKTLLQVDSNLIIADCKAIPLADEKLHCLIISEIDAIQDGLSELRLNNTRYRRITEDYPVGIFHTDINGNDLYINKKAEELMGLSFDKAMGSGWQESLHPDDVWVADVWRNASKNKKEINLEYRFLHNDGTVVWVKGESALKYDLRGNHIGYIGTLTDITKLHNIEEKLRQSQIEIAHYSRVNAMGEMVSGIAHELNQPLTVIANYANGCLRRLKAKNVGSEITESIQNIAAQAQRAGDIIHHLKDFLRKSEPVKSLCKINKCIKNIINIIRPTAENLNIHLTVNSTDENLVAQVDNIGIEQVLINLLQNAIEALTEYTSDYKEIKLELKKMENQIIIVVEDNGPGLNEQTENNIFNPFITTKKQGMGIGLSISKNIIDMHKGRLYYTPAKPHGCVFTIELPFGN